MSVVVMDVDFELRQLRYFTVLAEELHFGRAAARLRVAQPALSQAIRRLERRLGFVLFVRTSRRVELTHQGASFLANAQRVFAELRSGVDSGREIAAGRLGNVAIGHTALATVTVLPQVLRHFRERHPLVRLSLRELPSGAQIESLRAGYVDVALVTGTFIEDGLSSLELQRDPLVALVPSSHRLARRRQVSVASLAEEPFVLFPRDQIPPVHDQILGLCRSSGFEPAIGQVAQSWHMMAALVGVGLGVAVVPRSVKRYGVAGVRHIPIRPTVIVATTLYWRADQSSAVARHFISATQETAGNE
jgi:DNA-binding transcriptional LysR family regulator